MHRMKMAVALFAALTLSVATVSAQGLKVKGDAKAWSEIEAALIKLNKLKAFRQKMSAPEGSITMAIVAPNKVHTTFSAQGAESMETIMVGSEVRMRQGGGRWNCMPPGMKPPQVGPAAQQTDPSKMSGEVTASRGPAVAIDGEQTQSYSYTITSGGSATNFRIYIGVANGLPKRMQVLDARGAVTITIDYFDYDAPITVVLPACG